MFALQERALPRSPACPKIALQNADVPSPEWRFWVRPLNTFGRAEWRTPQSVGQPGIPEIAAEPMVPLSMAPPLLSGYPGFLPAA